MGGRYRRDCAVYRQMKRVIVFCMVASLALLLVLCQTAMTEEVADAMPKARYTGIAQQNVSVRAEMGTDSEILAYISKGDRVSILEYEPYWLKVVQAKGDGWVVGYVLRHTVSEVSAPKDDGLPYGAMPAEYTAVLAKDALLYASPELEGEALFAMTKGSKVAILSVENGWAKVLYWRQYGYFYLDAIEALTPVYSSDTAQSGDTIAAFITFFSLSEEGLNPNRIINIAQGCEHISIVLTSGKKFSFNDVAGPYRYNRGYLEAISYFEGRAVPSVGGGVCQVSSTLYNVLLLLPEGMEVIYRRAHGPSGATYLPHGVDAAVGSESLDLVFKNRFDFAIRIEASAHDGMLYIAMLKE